MRILQPIQATLLALALSTSLTVVAATDAPVKVVYHMSEGIPQASRAINQGCPIKIFDGIDCQKR